MYGPFQPPTLWLTSSEGWLHDMSVAVADYPSVLRSSTLPNNSLKLTRRAGR